MSDSELFDMPEKPKKKRVMSEEQKEVLRERLKLAREKKRLNRESKSKPKLTSIPDDNETDILKLQMDIEDLNMKLKKNKKQKTTARQIIYNRNRKAKQASDIERLVNEKVNQKLSQKTAPVIQNQPLKPPPVPRIIQPLGRRKPMW